MFRICTKCLLVCLSGCFLIPALSGQGKTLKVGIEMQGYPTGFIPGIRGDLYLSDFAKLHLRIGYNVVRHVDAGEHDDERGGGVGFTAGYDILPFSNHRWTTGIRADLWFNTIDWYDEMPGGGRIEGTTEITVLQPTIQAGYRIPFREKVELLPTIAFGYEWNIHTKGADVGQGAILLIGMILNFEL